MRRFFFVMCVICLSMTAFPKSVTLIPFQTYDVIVPMVGVTKVSATMFDALIKDFGCEDRIVNPQNFQLKSCIIFSCLESLERGKIFNITDNEIVVHLTYYYPHDIYEEDIVVKPRTFSRISAGGWPQKIICTF